MIIKGVKFHPNAGTGLLAELLEYYRIGEPGYCNMNRGACLAEFMENLQLNIFKIGLGLHW